MPGPVVPVPTCCCQFLLQFDERTATAALRRARTYLTAPALGYWRLLVMPYLSLVGFPGWFCFLLDLLILPAPLVPNISHCSAVSYLTTLYYLRSAALGGLLVSFRFVLRYHPFLPFLVFDRLPPPHQERLFITVVLTCHHLPPYRATPFPRSAATFRFANTGHQDMIYPRPAHAGTLCRYCRCFTVVASACHRWPRPCYNTLVRTLPFFCPTPSAVAFLI